MCVWVVVMALCSGTGMKRSDVCTGGAHGLMQRHWYEEKWCVYRWWSWPYAAALVWREVMCVRVVVMALCSGTGMKRSDVCMGGGHGLMQRHWYEEKWCVYMWCSWPYAAALVWREVMCVQVVLMALCSGTGMKRSDVCMGGGHGLMQRHWHEEKWCVYRWCSWPYAVALVWREVMCVWVVVMALCSGTAMKRSDVCTGGAHGLMQWHWHEEKWCVYWWWSWPYAVALAWREVMCVQVVLMALCSGTGMKRSDVCMGGGHGLMQWHWHEEKWCVYWWWSWPYAVALAWREVMCVLVVVMALCSGTGMKRSDVCTGGAHGLMQRHWYEEKWCVYGWWSWPYAAALVWREVMCVRVVLMALCSRTGMKRSDMCTSGGHGLMQWHWYEEKWCVYGWCSWPYAAALVWREVMCVQVVLMALCSGTGMKRSDVCTGGGHGLLQRHWHEEKWCVYRWWSWPYAAALVWREVMCVQVVVMALCSGTGMKRSDVCMGGGHGLMQQHWYEEKWCVYRWCSWPYAAALVWREVICVWVVVMALCSGTGMKRSDVCTGGSHCLMQWHWHEEKWCMYRWWSWPYAAALVWREVMCVQVVVMALCSGTGMKRSDVCTGGGHGLLQRHWHEEKWCVYRWWSWPYAAALVWREVMCVQVVVMALCSGTGMKRSDVCMGGGLGLMQQHWHEEKWCVYRWCSWPYAAALVWREVICVWVVVMALCSGTGMKRSDVCMGGSHGLMQRHWHEEKWCVYRWWSWPYAAALVWREVMCVQVVVMALCSGTGMKRSDVCMGGSHGLMQWHWYEEKWCVYRWWSWPYAAALVWREVMCVQVVVMALCSGTGMKRSDVCMGGGHGLMQQHWYEEKWCVYRWCSWPYAAALVWREVICVWVVVMALCSGTGMKRSDVCKGGGHGLMQWHWHEEKWCV